MNNTPTSKGVLLTTGIALTSVGSTLLAGEKWYVGLCLIATGVAIIFLREYLKEV